MSPVHPLGPAGLWAWAQGSGQPQPLPPGPGSPVLDAPLSSSLPLSGPSSRYGPCHEGLPERGDGRDQLKRNAGPASLAQWIERHLAD